MKKFLNFFERAVLTLTNPSTKIDARERISRSPGKTELPLDGFRQNNIESGQIEFLGDDDLSRLNSILPWMCFTADSKGRRFGSLAWKGKRSTPQVIPDKKIIWLDLLFQLSNKSV